MTFQIFTLHRGKFIWILLSCLFLSGFILSFVELQEIAKIIILLFCIPAILFVSVKFSFITSQWQVLDNKLIIERANENHEFLFKEIKYIKNHLRSGGNLIAIYKKGKSTPLRIWRNKLFSKVDEFDSMLYHLKNKGVEIYLG